MSIDDMESLLDWLETQRTLSDAFARMSETEVAEKAYGIVAATYDTVIKHIKETMHE